MNKTRQFRSSDQIISAFDSILRNLTDPGAGQERTTVARQQYPPGPAEPENLTPEERAHGAGLMRVNHVGEVCAQALYLGQAAVASDQNIADSMRQAAHEELAHLSWCDQRLQELGGRRSLLNPLWATGSLMIGMVVGVTGDKRSLGFIEETEAQVCAHLDGHLAKLPEQDVRSRKIVNAMRKDEAEHAERARVMGAKRLSPLARLLMKIQAKIMTTVAYRI